MTRQARRDKGTEAAFGGEAMVTQPDVPVAADGAAVAARSCATAHMTVRLTAWFTPVPETPRGKGRQE